MDGELQSAFMVMAFQPCLEVRHDISVPVRQQRRDELLLIAAAGTSVLVTSLLLRLVIWRGLLQPLVA